MIIFCHSKWWHSIKLSIHYLSMFSCARYWCQLHNVCYDSFSLCLHLSLPTLILPTCFILPTNVYHLAYIWVWLRRAFKGQDWLWFIDNTEWLSQVQVQVDRLVSTTHKRAWEEVAPILAIYCQELQELCSNAGLTRSGVWRWTKGLRRWCRGSKTPQSAW